MGNWKRSDSEQQLGAVDLGILLAVGLIGAIALVALGSYLGERLSPILSAWQVVAVFLLGLVFLTGEAVLPGFGILGLTGLALLVVAIVAAGAHSANLWRALSVVLIATPFLAYGVAREGIKRGWWRRMTLQDRLAEQEGYVAARAQTELVGRRGVAVTPLHPAGAAEIDGRRIDVVTLGDYIAAGEPVVVTEVQGVRVVVRKAQD